MTDKQPTAYEVPFVELLESVPNNSRLWVDFPEGMGSTHFPVGHYCHKAAAELRRLHEVNTELVEVLQEINEWAKAYPITIFPEPDFNKAHKVLTENGMTLDAISASNMRHVLTQVEKMVSAAIAKAAIAKATGEQQ